MRWLSLSFSWLVASACRGSASHEREPSGLGPDPEGCRSFATLASVDVGDSTGELRCRFDVASAEHRCELSLGGGFTSTVTEYASLADFVEAGHTLGKHTSLVETRIEKGQLHRLRHGYDELGRLVRSVDDSPGQTVVTRYFDHDGEGRPQRATSAAGGAEGGCHEWLETIEYAEDHATVSRRSRARDPERCGFGERTLVERYDGAGNRVGAVSADAAGIGASFVARHPTATERVCL
jgi:hypothetical protein